MEPSMTLGLWLYIKGLFVLVSMHMDSVELDEFKSIAY
jgi:hypothetical protein